MKVGDMVKYRGWSKSSRSEPLALVIAEFSPESPFHHRIRVVWVGENIPVQANVISTNAKRVSTWVSPKYFEVVSELDDKEDSDKQGSD